MAEHGAGAVLVADLDTAGGPGRAEISTPDPAAGHPDPRGVLILGHGAGGSSNSTAADLKAARALCTRGWVVALVDQPWRVAGRRVAGPPAHLDRAWLEMVPQVHAAVAEITAGAAGAGSGRALILGGRSAGARVACRTATALAATAVLALAFPMHPPRTPERSRGAELALPLAAGLPTLVVQGSSDPFGGPEQIRRAVPAATTATTSCQDDDSGDDNDSDNNNHGNPLLVASVRGNHSLDADPAQVTWAIAEWLDGLPLSRQD